MLLRSGSRAKRLRRMAPISSPSNTMRPEVWSSSRITIIDVVDLPQPDSPTRPTLSPWPTVKLMPSTARNMSRFNRRLAGEQQFAEHRRSRPGAAYSLTSFSTEEERAAPSSPEGGEGGRDTHRQAVDGASGRCSPRKKRCGPPLPPAADRASETPSRGVARINFLV